jgi:hypothetical protein
MAGGIQQFRFISYRFVYLNRFIRFIYAVSRRP